VLSRAITPKRRGRRPLTAIAIITIAAGLLAATGSVLAVHDEEFQLDGDTSSTAITNPNAPGAAPAQDWETLFNADGTPTGVIDTDAATGFNDGRFTRDFRSKVAKGDSCTTDAALSSPGLIFCTNDFTTFATGSKDTLEINTGWQCNRDNNVNSKIDIMNAYAAQYIDPTSGDQIMSFGLTSAWTRTRTTATTTLRSGSSRTMPRACRLAAP
jgi:hypothetical protein